MRAGIGFTLGPLDVEAGGMRVHVWRRLWLPDGLHVWCGRRGVHIFWSRSPHARRITFDRMEAHDG